MSFNNLTHFISAEDEHHGGNRHGDLRGGGQHDLHHDGHVQAFHPGHAL